MPSGRRGTLGVRGEDAVAAWYRRAGYEVVAQNWRCDQGEIDIVALGPAGDVVVFCEVKTRTSDRFGTPFEAVTTSKQRRVRRLATRWLAQGRAAGRPAYARVRFDVAAVTVHAGALDVEVLEDAF